jgi:hypothetical protein
MIHALKLIVKTKWYSYLLPKPNPNETISNIHCVSGGLKNSYIRYFGRGAAKFEDPRLTEFWWRNLKEEACLKDLDADGRIINWILTKYVRTV